MVLVVCTQQSGERRKSTQEVVNDVFYHLKAWSLVLTRACLHGVSVRALRASFVVLCNLKKKKNDPLHKQSAMSRWKVPPNKLCMRLTKEDGDLSCMSCDFSVPSF